MQSGAGAVPNGSTSKMARLVTEKGHKEAPEKEEHANPNLKKGPHRWFLVMFGEWAVDQDEVMQDFSPD